MPTWDDLPREIRDHVLYIFCLDAIDDYIALTDDFDECIDLVGSWFVSPSTFWPRSPQSLRDFSSVFRTCRYFHTVLTDIKYDAKSPVEILQTLQHNKVQYILNGLFDCDCQNCHLGELFRLVGCFWKNSKILDDPKCIGDVLKRLSGEGFMMLIPHLQDWVLKHTEPEPEINSDVYSDVKSTQGTVTLDIELYNHKGARLRSSRMSFKKGSSGMSELWGGLRICSIAGCVTPAEEAACKGLRRKKRGTSDKDFERLS
jgi:hypothetical protein